MSAYARKLEDELAVLRGMNNDAEEWYEKLKPCPFCGCAAEMQTIPDEHPDAGAMFVQCSGHNCLASSALIYPLMDDVAALARERWNKRHNV